MKENWSFVPAYKNKSYSLYRFERNIKKQITTFDAYVIDLGTFMCEVL